MVDCKTGCTSSPFYPCPQVVSMHINSGLCHLTCLSHGTVANMKQAETQSACLSMLPFRNLQSSQCKKLKLAHKWWETLSHLHHSIDIQATSRYVSESILHLSAQLTNPNQKNYPTYQRIRKNNKCLLF